MELGNDRSLILRVCGPNGESHGTFLWPLTVGAEVSAPDWKPIKECGNGLHGWLHGAGDHSCIDRWADQGARWIVASVETASIIELGGKCKFPKCRVEFVGERQDAAAFIREHSEYARNAAVIGAVVAVGNDASVVVGALGTATAGDSGTATAGDSGVISTEWYDRKADRYRRTIGYIGENGLEPNVAYRCDDAGKFVRAEG